MGNIFRYDSPFMTKLAMVFNLILLNVLWLLTAWPIITIGAANTAMNYVLFQFLTNRDDSVIKPYFRSFFSNFKQSTIAWIPMLAVIALLLLDLYYLLTHTEGTAVLWIAFAVVLMVLTAMTTYVFGLIARFQNTLRDTLRNSLLLFFLNFIPSVSMVLVSALPVLVYLFLPQLFMRIGILWLMFGVSLFAYINAFTMLRVFKKHMPAEDKQEEAAEGVC